jgi:hypothetical protein
MCGHRSNVCLLSSFLICLSKQIQLRSNEPSEFYLDIGGNTTFEMLVPFKCANVLLILLTDHGTGVEWASGWCG